MQFYIFHKKAFYLSTPGPARKRRLEKLQDATPEFAALRENIIKSQKKIQVNLKIFSKI